MKDFIVKKLQKVDYVQYTCRIEYDVLEKIKSIVTQNNLKSANVFINECLKYSLKNMKLD